MKNLLSALALLTALALPAGAAQQIINRGDASDDRRGDSVYTFTSKINSNFSENYSAISALTAALAGKAASIHTHVIGDVTGLQAALNGKQPLSAVLTSLSAGTPLPVAGGGTGAASLTAALDTAFGATRGNVLYRGATGWSALAPGTAGQFLATGGAGADPAWTTLSAAVPPQASVRLTYTSTTSLTVAPYEGNQLYINGANRTITSISCPNTGLTASTLYYVYVTSAPACELSTTAYAIDGVTGMPFKSGDATRTLVGMAYTDAGTPGTFADTAAKRWTASWFKRRKKNATSGVTSGSTASTSGYVDLTAFQVNFISWGDAAQNITWSGVSQNGYGGGNTTYTEIKLDGSVVGQPMFIGVPNAFGANHTMSTTETLTAGAHTVLIAGYGNSAYNIVWYGKTDVEVWQ